MWQRANMSSGGGTPTVSVNEYRLSNNSADFQCTAAWFMIGTPTAQGQYYYGYLINGVVTIIFSYSSYNISVTYNNGVLRFQAPSALPTDRDYLKIMYM